MSRNTKIVVGIIAGILILCCIIAIVAFFVLRPLLQGVSQGFDNPEAGAEVAQGIVDYELPPGYEEQGAMNLLVMEMAFISGGDEQNIIMLAEFSDVFTGNEEDMQQQMQDAFANQAGSQTANLTFVEDEQMTINGEPATLATYEGTDEQGNQVRQQIGVFVSKSGNPAMLMIFGYEASWDEAGINRFLDSLE